MPIGALSSVLTAAWNGSGWKSFIVIVALLTRVERSGVLLILRWPILPMIRAGSIVFVRTSNIRVVAIDLLSSATGEGSSIPNRVVRRWLFVNAYRWWSVVSAGENVKFLQRFSFGDVIIGLLQLFCAAPSEVA